MQILLDLWREACRHIELGEAMPRLATLVRRGLPADLLLIRRIDASTETVDTVAASASERLPLPRQARSQFDAHDAERLLHWAQTGKPARWKATERGHPLAALVPESIRGSVAAGPLRTADGAAGVLLLVRRAPASFSADELETLAPLLEPFSVALGNHLRILELKRLREAADARSRSLLSKLRRQEIVEEIVGEEGSLRGVMERVEQVAATDAPVLLLGETGTGKEVVARAIHARSARRDGPIVRVNCGAIPPELIDSELFGHERGSFTGAVAERKGWFERADGGTLFLDEVAELPPAAQVRLLRVLQDGSYERVGAQETRTADVRVLAATHRDLEGLVRDGRFREDLWYRISVFPLYLPPLRARLGDLPALVRHFARNAGLRFGGVPLEPTQDDLAMLATYPWPGNVRELAAVVERAAILGGGHRLDFVGAMGTKLYALGERLGNDAPGANGSMRLDDAMARHIEQALRQTKGQIEGPDGAAALLDINPHTLRGRMRKLGVDWRRFR